MKGVEIWHQFVCNRHKTFATHVGRLGDEICKDHALADLSRRHQGELDRSRHALAKRRFDARRTFQKLRVVHQSKDRVGPEM
jgi:hypothetical protein